MNFYRTLMILDNKRQRHSDNHLRERHNLEQKITGTALNFPPLRILWNPQSAALNLRYRDGRLRKIVILISFRWISVNRTYCACNVFYKFVRQSYIQIHFLNFIYYRFVRFNFI